MKFGKTAPKVTPRTWRSMSRMNAALDRLAPPPAASNDYRKAVKVPWQIFMNDSLGDCVCADSAHTRMLRTANTGNIQVPTDADVLALYKVVGGYRPGDPSTDNGCNESDMCWYLQRTGWLGDKIDEFASVNPHSADNVKWAIQLFGSVRIGFQVPAYAMAQFSARQPWDVQASGDQTIVGGHDVPLVGYAGDMYVALTWGKEQPVTRAFFEKYCDEVHVELDYDWTRAQGVAPSGLDLDQLASSLLAVRH